MSLKITQSSERTSALVGSTPPFDGNSIFVTISPNPHTKHEVKKSNGKKLVQVSIPYKNLSVKSQYVYCMHIVNTVYMPLLEEGDSLVGTWEFNSNSDIHFHMLIHSPSLHKLKNNNFNLICFRKSVSEHPSVLRNMKKGGNMTDYMNNIVYLNKPYQELLSYFDKDYDEESHSKLNNYYYNF